MKKLSRIIGVAVLTLSLGSGVASAATGTIDTTGPDSNNQVTVNNAHERRVEVQNRVSVSANSDQRATTGDATARHNTTAGSAMSGEAVNDNLTRANLTLSNEEASSAALATSNSGSDNGSIRLTGPDSNNQVTFNNGNTTTVDLENCIELDVNSEQTARSGDARVSGNTTGGSAVSGDATNINTSEFTLTVRN